MLTPSEHNHRIVVLNALVRELMENPPPPCCLNCGNFVDAKCMVFGAIADEHQRTPGCPAWEEPCPF